MPRRFPNILKRSILEACLTALAGAATLSAQDPIEAALDLARKGQTSRAEEMCQQILAGGKATPEVRAAIEVVRAENLLSRAAEEKSLQGSQDLIDASVALLQRFLRSHPRHPLAMEARRGIDWRRFKKAERCAAAVEAESDTRLRADLARRARDLFSGLELHYQDRVREIAGGKPTPESQTEVMELTLEMAKALLEASRLSTLEPEERRRRLREAIERLQDFQLQYCDNVTAFEACLVEGQCHAELGELDTAMALFQEVIGLSSLLAEARLQATEYCLEVVRGAHISLAEAHLRADRHQEAIAAADRALESDAGLENEEAGRILKLIKAEGLFALEEFSAAQDLATQVMAADPAGRLGAAARNKLRFWSSHSRAAGGGGRPEEILAGADSLMEREQWLDAMSALRRGIEACVTDDERSRLTPPAHYKMGLCCARLGRNHEAVFAFERVFAEFSRHPLAPRACFEAARSLAAEFSSSADAADDARKEEILGLLAREWPDHPCTRNVAFLQAEKAEKAKDLKRAAELYLQVPADAEAHEAALVGAARAYYQGAVAVLEARDTAAADAEAARADLQAAAEALQRYAALASRRASAGDDAESARQRSNLGFLGVQQLALVYTHEAIARHEECLQALDSYIKAAEPAGERLARILALKIRSHLAQGKVDDAASVLEAMLARLPDSPSTSHAARAVAGGLQKATDDLIGKAAEPERVRENLNRLHRYYLKWVNDALTRGLRLTAADVLSAADALYQAARRLNGLDDDGAASFLAVPEGSITEPEPFGNAALVLGVLAEGKAGKLREKDRLEVLVKLARATSFGAADLASWEKARGHYAAIVDGARLLDTNGDVDTKVAQANPSLLAVYLELGGAYLALGRMGQKFQFDNALTAFANVLKVTGTGSEPWWLAKYLTLRALYQRGAESDARTARTILENLEKNYPEYDGDKFRIRSRILELKGKLPGTRA